MPTVIGPQIILGGTIMPVESLPDYLEWPARLMPVTYLIEGMRYVGLDAGDGGDLWLAIGALEAFTVASVAVSSAVVRRAG